MVCESVPDYVDTFILGVLRILIAFKDSVYEYSKKVITFVLFWLLSATIYFQIISFVGFKAISAHNDKKNYYYCKIFSENIWLSVSASVVDMISNIVLFILFAKPLVKMSHESQLNQSYIYIYIYECVFL